jgi:hypothetical protein
LIIFSINYASLPPKNLHPIFSIQFKSISFAGLSLTWIQPPKSPCKVSSGTFLPWFSFGTWDIWTLWLYSSSYLLIMWFKSARLSSAMLLILKKIRYVDWGNSMPYLAKVVLLSIYWTLQNCNNIQKLITNIFPNDSSVNG